MTNKMATENKLSYLADLEEALNEFKIKTLGFKQVENITMNKKSWKKFEEYCETVCTYKKGDNIIWETFYKDIPVLIDNTQEEPYKINYK